VFTPKSSEDPHLLVPLLNGPPVQRLIWADSAAVSPSLSARATSSALPA
jgi:hypothetical protein